MTLAGIEIRYLVNELSQMTKDYYVSNIYGINRNSLLFKLHHPKKPDIPLMFSTLGLWMSSVKIDQHEKNPMLRTLRNLLLRSKPTKIEQIGVERIVYVTFSGLDEEFILIGEFFGNGNIILCNKDLKILALLHSINVRHRKLRVGLNYQPPPPNSVNILEVTKKNFEEILSAPSVGKWVGRTLGLPSKYVEEISNLAKIDPKEKGSNLSDKDVVRLYDTVKSLTEKIVKGDHESYIVQSGEESDVSPIPLIQNEGKDTKKVDSFMEALDAVFTETLLNQGRAIQTSSIDKKIKELENEVEEQIKAILLVNERSKAISDLAKLLLKQASKGSLSIEDTGISEILTSQDSSISKEKGLSFIKISDQKIQINPKSSLQTIASILFDESKKQTAAVPSIESMKKKTEKKMEQMKKKSDVAKDSVTFSEIRKKEWYERYRWFYTTDGLLTIGGRDASSNSSVIRKHLDKNDKVFHAEIFGSPFFLLKDSEDSSPSSVIETARATVCFSRAWREALFGLSAYWVNPDQVKKAAPSGQSLAKGSFVIEGKRNFVKVPNMQLCVGLYQKGDKYSIMCGPPEPVKKNCIYYVTIEPTGPDMVELGKKVRLEFLKLEGIEEIVKSLSIDDFVRVLPAGNSHIVSSGKGEAYQ